MRFLATVFLSWCCAVQAASTPTNRAAVLQAPNQPYVDLSQWAHSNQLRLTRKGDEVQLTSRTTKLSLRVNSARADVNGVSVFLGFPLLLREDKLWMAGQDLERSLAFILFPAKRNPSERVRTIAISAGHGGKDAGYQLGAHQEKKYTLLLAKELQKRCARAGLKTVLIRDSDIYLTLAERTQRAKAGKADVYIELHYNCAGPGNKTSKGVEVYCLTLDGATSTNGGTERFPGSLAGNRFDQRNIFLAYQVQRSLVSHTKMADRGVRRARFEVLRDAQMPAVLVEAGFMSEPGEMHKIQDAGFRRRAAQAILDGVLAYKWALDR